MVNLPPWHGTIGCEGGPVIVANAADFEHWRGADPLPRSERRSLHVWSSFTSSLPERFRPNGPTGHQFIHGTDYGDLERMRDQLFEVLMQKWPGSIITEQFETWMVRRPDGAELRATFDPTSEYDRCMRDLLEVKLHTFDTGRSCVVWSVEPGLVEVVRGATGRLLLVQVRDADDEESAASAARRAIDETNHEDGFTDIALTIDPGPVVVAWAPNSAADETWSAPHHGFELTAPGELLDLATGHSGARLALPSGNYRVAVGESGDDRTGVVWCALVPVGPAQLCVAAGGASPRS